MEAADYERIPVLWRRQDVRTGAEMARAMGERSGPPQRRILQPTVQESV